MFGKGKDIMLGKDVIILCSVIVLFLLGVALLLKVEDQIYPIFEVGSRIGKNKKRTACRN
jgi:hypothetical protein